MGAQRTRVVGIHFHPWGSHAEARTVREKWARFVERRAFPRTPAHMSDLFARSFPGHDLVPAPERPEELEGVIRDRESVVLVVSDAIGLYAGSVEAYLMRACRIGGTELRMLTGRGREFALDGHTLRRLKRRRFLEVVPIVDCLFVAGLLLASPLFWAADTLRGVKDVYR